MVFLHSVRDGKGTHPDNHTVLATGHSRPQDEVSCVIGVRGESQVQDLVVVGDVSGAVNAYQRTTGHLEARVRVAGAVTCIAEITREHVIAVADTTGTITFWSARPSSGTMPLLAAFRLAPLSWLDPTGAAVKAAKKLADFMSVIQGRRLKREQDRADEERLELMRKYPDAFKADYSDFRKKQQEKRSLQRKEAFAAAAGGEGGGPGAGKGVGGVLSQLQAIEDRKGGSRGGSRAWGGAGARESDALPQDLTRRNSVSKMRFDGTMAAAGGSWAGGRGHGHEQGQGQGPG